MEKWQLFHVKNVCKNVKINKIKWTYGLFGHKYRIATLSTLYLTILGTMLILYHDKFEIDRKILTYLN